MCVKEDIWGLPTIAFVAVLFIGGLQTGNLYHDQRNCTPHAGNRVEANGACRPFTETPAGRGRFETRHDLGSAQRVQRRGMAGHGGFEGGSTDEDWYEAEAEMRERFGAADSQVETVQIDRGAAANMETEGE
jgi:hypothetical protein